MKLAVIVTLITMIASIKAGIHLRPTAEASNTYSDNIPQTLVNKPRAAYVPSPGYGPEYIHYKAYDTDSNDYDRKKREIVDLDWANENWISQKVIDDAKEVYDVDE